MQRTPDIYHSEDGDALPPPKSERIARFRDEIGILDEAEAAGILGWQPRTLQAARLTNGDAPPWRKLGRRIVYLKAEVEAWLRDRPVSTYDPFGEVTHRASPKRRTAG